MEQNIVEVINSLGKTNFFRSIGEIEMCQITQAAEALGIVFAKDFVEYTQKFGAVLIGGVELFGVVNSKNLSTVVRTQSMREFPDFPLDCYVIESLGIDNIVIVQKADGKVYQYTPGEDLEPIANSFGEYLLGENKARKERNEYWKESAKDL